MPSLPSSLSHFSAFSSVCLSRMKRLPFRPLAAMLSPFPLLQKSLLLSPPALRMGQKHRLAGRRFKAAIIGTC